MAVFHCMKSLPDIHIKAVANKINGKKNRRYQKNGLKRIGDDDGF